MRLKAGLASPDPIEQLQKLGQLRDAGILTEDEFLAKKSEILSRM
ncbi:MAG: SHOCT domain-containing protein [Actinomycetota bacterium]|nr:SHOCT domain-containing protein [Actinomycetota bacterium]